MNNAPKLSKIFRLDSIPLSQTYFTDEGYLIDHPVVTTVGIFEYKNPDGSIRRELRLPEEVFSEKSLSTYEGKPVIVTHAAGEINKDNVEDETIGTILSKGYRDGDNVRAKIIIHDTDSMKECGLRELSLGYNLTLDETPGDWNGQHYDAIQRNIEINHLALVSSARAGGEARLNIDGKSKKNLQGGVSMKKTKNADSGAMSPEDLAASIEAYKARKGARCGSNGDADPAAVKENAPVQEAAPVAADEGTGEEVDVVKKVMDRRDRRDSTGDPETIEDAMGVIAQQDEDIEELLKYCDQLKAKGDFAAAKEDGDESKSENLNMDSVDVLVSKKLEIARIGDKLNLDGVEKLSLKEGKKAIIKKVRPDMRLDDKSDAYIDAAFDIAKSEIEKKKSTDFQRGQMFNADSAAKVENLGKASADEARKRMIERQNGGNK